MKNYFLSKYVLLLAKSIIFIFLALPAYFYIDISLEYKINPLLDLIFIIIYNLNTYKLYYYLARKLETNDK